jgi:predicted transcriptional regulator
LILPCEVAVKSVVPAIKALMAKKLVEEHGLKQDQVAEILGISQSAVSKYSRNIRGYAVKLDSIEEIYPLLNEMASLVMTKTYKRASFIDLFCKTCMEIRRKKIMCSLCQKSDSAINIQQCGSCYSSEP